MRFLLILFSAFNVYVTKCPTMSISKYGQLLCIVLAAGILLNFIMGLIMNAFTIENNLMWFLFNGFSIDVENVGAYFKANLLGLILWLAFCGAAYFGISNII
ncbi:hypothetical protein [Paraclostridium bifermentans]|uniref:hypothetical protein n=1 Tax=Paraclostridium bifermentans TaxID=1490 RepID=UPI00374F050D